MTTHISTAAQSKEEKHKTTLERHQSEHLIAQLLLESIECWIIHVHKFKSMRVMIEKYLIIAICKASQI